MGDTVARLFHSEFDFCLYVAMVPTVKAEASNKIQFYSMKKKEVLPIECLFDIGADLWFLLQ